MRVRVLASVVIGSLAASGASFAEEPVHSFACDTPPGHFSDWTQSLSPGPVEITGTLTVNELRTDKKWSPVAGVMLDGGADGRTSFGVRLLANLKVKDMYFIEMHKPDGSEAMGLAGMIPRTQDPIPFSVALDAGGKLVVRIAGAEATTDVGAFQPRGLSLSCSTGDFVFKNVTIRRP
jgi:hypothetical protein